MKLERKKISLEFFLENLDLNNIAPEFMDCDEEEDGSQPIYEPLDKLIVETAAAATNSKKSQSNKKKATFQQGKSLSA